MKYSLTCLFGLTLYTLFAQNFNPTAVEGAHWIMIGQSNKDLTYNDIGFSYTCTGDTTTNGFSYKKLYKENFRWNSATKNFYQPYQVIEKKLVGYLRDDATLKRTYFRPVVNAVFTGCNFPNEYILFDFNFEVGDQLDMNDCIFEKLGYFPTIASKVNAYYPNFDDKKRTTYFFIEPDLPNKLIEGIGYNSVGLFYYPSLSHFVYLKEYCIGSNLQCGLILNDIDQIDATKLKIITSNGSFEMSYEPVAEGCYLQVTDVIGQVKTVQQLQSENLEVQLANLQEGFYIASVFGGRKLLASRKFVIAR